MFSTFDSLYILDINDLSDLHLMKTFFYSVDCCIPGIIATFALQTLVVS